MGVDNSRKLPVVDLTRKAAGGRHVLNVDSCSTVDLIRKAANGRHVVNVDGRSAIDFSHVDISQLLSHVP